MSTLRKKSINEHTGIPTLYEGRGTHCFSIFGPQRTPWNGLGDGTTVYVWNKNKDQRNIWSYIAHLNAEDIM